ncbi:MAG: cell division protein FtsZ [Candidatus Thermoplasmatota archaeon]
MKTILTEALERRNVAQQEKPTSTDDAELEEILKTLKVNIKIIGCGGAGSNTINRLVEAGVSGAEMFACNTDAKHLLAIHAPKKILIGRRSTKGLGAGAIPEVGEEAAKEAEDELKAVVKGADIAFVTCGLGGGTGTGALPYIARHAKDAGALTMAVVTLPFKSEGQVRMQNAEYGLEKLARICDTVIVIPNDKLLELVPKLPLDSAFRVADEILMRSIKGITEIITRPGLVNLDFNDLKTVVTDGGIAMVGIGESEEDNRAVEAVNEAISSPLLDVDIGDAKGAMVCVTGGPDMTISEAEKVTEIIGSKINPMARIIWGCIIDPTLERKIRVLLVLTGVKSKQMMGQKAVLRPMIRGDVGIEFIK